MSIGEFFVVCENGEMILFQTSTVDPSKHEIKLAQLQKWVAAVKPKSIKIIYFTDWCEKGTTRVTVMDGNENLNDSQVSERLFDESNTHSFKSYIVRCGIFTKLKRYILSGDTTSLGSLVDEYKKKGKNQVSSS
jgi:hydroxymethylpyrimidine pyrophosphatase-like HAD family hydrolase